MKLLIACLLAVLAAPAFGQDIARMDQVVPSFAADKRFMGAVLVARGPETVLS
jgi:hypothetical protein